MKNAVSKGLTMDYTATADITSGQVVLVGAMIGIAVSALASGETGALTVEGVFTVPKSTGVVAQGAQVYWDNTNKNVTTTATDNTPCGKAFIAAASGDAEIDIKINV